LNIYNHSDDYNICYDIKASEKTPIVMKNFNKNIRDFRKKAELTQEELGQKAGVSGTYIGEIERGEAPNVSLKVIYDLSEALNIPLCILTGEMTLEEYEVFQRLKGIVSGQ
jgi:transcriptional regulator with XRE-family HTH domain